MLGVEVALGLTVCGQNNWDWAREEITANLCWGTKAAVQEKLGNFFAQLANRTEEVKQRSRTALQT